MHFRWSLRPFPPYIYGKARKGSNSLISFTCCRWNTGLESKHLRCFPSPCLWLTAFHLQTYLFFSTKMSQRNVAETLIIFIFFCNTVVKTQMNRFKQNKLKVISSLQMPNFTFMCLEIPWQNTEFWGIWVYLRNVSRKQATCPPSSLLDLAMRGSALICWRRCNYETQWWFDTFPCLPAGRSRVFAWLCFRATTWQWTSRSWVTVLSENSMSLSHPPNLC